MYVLYSYCLSINSMHIRRYSPFLVLKPVTTTAFATALDTHLKPKKTLYQRKA